MDELADRTSRTAVGDRLTARGIRRIQVGKVAVEDDDDQEVGLAAAKQMYSKAVTSAENDLGGRQGRRPAGPGARRAASSTACRGWSTRTARRCSR